MEEKLATIKIWMILANKRIEVAEKLYELNYFDDATSRAYYGMFHAAKAALLSIDVEVKSHAGVVNKFSQQFIKAGQVERKYGRMLSLAMRARELSDYGTQVYLSETTAEATIADAKLFVAKIKEILQNRS